LAPGALVCGGCHALVHAEKLEQLAASARLHEDAHDIGSARSDWDTALALLPPDSTQAEWIRGNTRRLDALSVATQATKAQHGWARRLGPFAPLAIVLAKGKFLLTLFKLKSLLSLGTFARRRALHHAGPADDHRFANTALAGRAFAAAQRQIVRIGLSAAAMNA
jgi:hypothetical protein